MFYDLSWIQKSLLSKEERDKARQAKKDAQHAAKHDDEEGDVEVGMDGRKSSERMNSFNNNDSKGGGGGRVSFSS